MSHQKLMAGIDSRAQVAGRLGNPSNSNDNMQSGTDAAVVVEALNRLTLAFQPRSASVTHTPAGTQPVAVATEDTGNGEAGSPTTVHGSVAPLAEHGAATGAQSDPIDPELSEFLRGTPYKVIDAAILEALAATDGLIMGAYDRSCPITQVAAPDDAMDWQPTDHGAS